MALPQANVAKYELTLPSQQKKIKYRPFLVKEEKILLIAQESQDLDQIILAIKQIIGNCFEKIDVDSLSTFDIESGTQVELRYSNTFEALDYENNYYRVADVLCDLKHYCDKFKIDFDQESKMSEIYYDDEVEIIKNQKGKL